MQVALSNLDLVLLESRSQFEQLLPHILEDMERQWTARFRPAVTAPASDRAHSSMWAMRRRVLVLLKDQMCAGPLKLNAKRCYSREHCEHPAYS